MAAKPQRDATSLIEPSGDDADQLRSLLSSILSGACPEDAYLHQAASLCRGKPEFARRLLVQLERYSRLGELPVAQYTRVRQQIEVASAASRESPADRQRTADAAGDWRAEAPAPRSASASTVTAAVGGRPRVPPLPAEATLTAPLPTESANTARPSPSRPAASSPAAAAAATAPAPTTAPAAATTPAAPAASASTGAAPVSAPASTPAAAPAPAPAPRPPKASRQATRPPRSARAGSQAAPSSFPLEHSLQPAAAASQAAGPVIGPGTLLRERYELEGLLGCGGMANVYKALDRYRASLGLTDCHIALKIVVAQAAAAAEDGALGREFHNAQQLSHPNIVNVFEIDHEAGATFYTMELLEGEQLDELLGRIGGPLPQAQALTIVRDIGAAIEHAHSRGILHADLKPQNVFVTFGGQVRVLDFGGLSLPFTGLWIREPSLVPAPERYRTATPAYASCEQLEGQQVDARDDIYALACIAYELLTGRHPYDGNTALQARAQHLRPRRPPLLTGSSWRALRRALSFRRAQRPRDIAPWLEQLGIASAAARLPPSYELRTPPPRSHLGRWAALAAALVLCVSGALAFALQNPGPLDWSSMLSAARNSLRQAGNVVQERLAGRPGTAATTTTAAAPANAESEADLPAGLMGAAHRTTHHADSPPQVGTAVTGAAARPKVAAAPATGAVVAADAGPPAAGAVAPPAAPGGVSAHASTLGAQGIEFSSMSYEVNDTSPAARVVVRRSGGTQDELRFEWWTLDDTAKADVDYAPLGKRTEHMLPGQDHVTLYVPIISNPLRHATTTFFVALGRPGATEASPSARASVTIERGG